MFAVLIGGLVSGYLACNNLGLSEHWAKKIMTFVLISLNWVISLFVIWRMELRGYLIWLPITGVTLMLTVTAFSAVFFSFFKLESKSRLTLILAGGTSNVGYTGAAFVCYALFGATGLAMANIYLLFTLPTLYLVYLPLLKVYELRSSDENTKFKLGHLLDLRCLVIPAIITALICNFMKLPPPGFVSKFYIVDIFVYVASSLSFFAIGMQVNLSRLKNNVSLYFPVAAIKFILTPVLALSIIWVLSLSGQNLTGMIQKVIIVLSAAPGAVIMVTMSNVFDLDGPLASALWVVTMVIFALVVVPVLFLLFA